MDGRLSGGIDSRVRAEVVVLGAATRVAAGAATRVTGGGATRSTGGAAVRLTGGGAVRVTLGAAVRVTTGALVVTDVETGSRTGSTIGATIGVGVGVGRVARFRFSRLARSFAGGNAYDKVASASQPRTKMSGEKRGRIVINFLSAARRVDRRVSAAGLRPGPPALPGSQRFRHEPLPFHPKHEPDAVGSSFP